MARIRETPQDDGAGHCGAEFGHVGGRSFKALTTATIIILDRDQAPLQLVRGYVPTYPVLAEGSEVDNQLQR